MKPDITETIENEGIEVSRNGHFRCPFHEDRNPSGRIFEDNRFHCFGCSAHGDAFDFVMKLKGFGYREASKYLGVKAGKRPAHITKQDVFKAFKDWEREYYDKLALIYRVIHKALRNAKDMEELEMLVSIHDSQTPELKRKMNIIIHGTDVERYALFKESHHGLF